MRYCIWHKHRARVAVNLGGQRLENMTREGADQIMSLIHQDIRPMVEIRPMAGSIDTSSMN